MIDSDTASMATHDTFASYKVGTFVYPVNRQIEHQSISTSSSSSTITTTTFDCRQNHQMQWIRRCNTHRMQMI